MLYNFAVSFTDATTSVSFGQQVDLSESATVKALREEVAALKAEVAKLKSQLKDRPQADLVTCVEQSEKSAKFYTGMTKAHLEAFWKFLAGEAPYLRVYGTDKLAKEKRMNENSFS